jgi:cytochrome c oxidase subunit IV
MTTAAAANGRLYWMTWGVLLLVTLVMIWFDTAQVSRGVLIVVLLTAMAVKATLIAGNFMHLRHEHRGLILTVVLGLFVLGVVLYVLIVPDALRIREMMGGS